MDEEETTVETWHNIAKYTRYSEQTVRRKFGKEMLALHIVMKSHIGRSKRPVVWGWPPMIRQYFREKSKMGEL